MNSSASRDAHFISCTSRRRVHSRWSRKRSCRGLPITCEVAPHHFSLSEDAVASYDPIFKVHPPLRAASDVAALRSALGAGVIDAIATDHAPHAPELKDRAFDEAPAGMLGLEHAASLTYEALGDGDASATVFFSLLSRAPARIAQLRQSDVRPRHSAHGGGVRAGEDANIVVFDPRVEWTVSRDQLQSRATNTPYDERRLVGRTSALVAKGRLVVRDGMLL